MNEARYIINFNYIKYIYIYNIQYYTSKKTVFVFEELSNLNNFYQVIHYLYQAINKYLPCDLYQHTEIMW